MSFAATFLMFAQVASAQPAIEPTSATIQATASARILRPVTFRLEDGAIEQQQDYVAPQRSDAGNGQIWFEFS